MPRDRRDIHVTAGTSLDLPRAFLVPHFRLAAAQHVADVGGVGVAHVLRPWWECATCDADLGVLKDLLAGLLTLPLYRQSVRDIVAPSSKRGDQDGRAEESRR